MGTEPVAVALHIEKAGMMQNPIQENVRTPGASAPLHT